MIIDLKDMNFESSDAGEGWGVFVQYNQGLFLPANKLWETRIYQ